LPVAESACNGRDREVYGCRAAKLAAIAHTPVVRSGSACHRAGEPGSSWFSFPSQLVPRIADSVEEAAKPFLYLYEILRRKTR
jgi:hypothetical protein